MATDDEALRAEVDRLALENRLLRAAQESEAATAWAKVERHLVTAERDALRAEVARLRVALGTGDELSRKSTKEIIRLRDEVARLTGEGKESQEAIRIAAETAADWMRVSITRVAVLASLIVDLTEALGNAAAEAHARCPGGGPFTTCPHEHCQHAARAWAKSRERCAKVKAWTWH